MPGKSSFHTNHFRAQRHGFQNAIVEPVYVDRHKVDFAVRKTLGSDLVNRLALRTGKSNPLHDADDLVSAGVVLLQLLEFFWIGFDERSAPAAFEQSPRICQEHSVPSAKFHEKPV